jgi:electron transfer flavoprotein alpha subunit
MSILVLCEHEGGVFKKTAAELLGKGRELATALGVDCHALVLGEANAAALGGFGASKAFVVSGAFGGYDTDVVTAAIHAGIQAAQPKYVLAPASFTGKDAMPRVAARLGTGQASECTALTVAGGELVGRRPVYSGKALVDAKVTRFPGIYTVRANSFPQPANSGASAEVVAVSFAAPAPRLTVVDRLKPEGQAVDLAEADRIVSGGRSLKSKEQFDAVVRPLAAAFGATAGASRAAVDAGYAHHEDQVGQTGKTVNPTVYIALGISGAIQHLAGMRTSKVIVAVNKDPEAPIFEHATYGIVGDLFEVAPLLQAAFEQLDA